MVLNSFRAYMEYKHEPETKEYIITLIETLTYTIILIIFTFIVY
ncbi:DUF4181 domain-containing protein [Virgibacillus soli]